MITSVNISMRSASEYIIFLGSDKSRAARARKGGLAQRNEPRIRGSRQFLLLKVFPGGYSMFTFGASF